MKLTEKFLFILALAAGSNSFAANAYDFAGNLPVMYITTEGNKPVVDKAVYLDATYYIEGMDSGFESVGSASEQLPLGIKGRGNYTWVGFDKKPYKLKLDKKTDLLGMPKSKHYALLAHVDDPYAYLRNEIGFDLSRRLNLAWTPGTQPVEVVLNGSHIGLYFLTETIRVEKTRVDITEQDDLEQNDENITGGWLLEIDNYDTDPHVSVTEGNGQRIIFTYKSPEELSDKQKNFLQNQMEALNAAIYTADKNDASKLTDMLDLESAAKFYVVQEIMDDCESYHGSCYIYRDRGDDAKWHFGPVWDFGNAYTRDDKNFIYVNPAFNQTWIGELAKFPAFQEEVKRIWSDTAVKFTEDVCGDMDAFVAKISKASEINDRIWPQYAVGELKPRLKNFKSHFINSMKWLGKQWGAEPDIHTPVYLRGMFNSWATTDEFDYLGEGMYEIKGVTLSDQFKIADADWSAIDYGMPENAGQIVLGEPYQLAYRGANIPGIEAENIDILFNLNNATMTVSNHSVGVDNVAAEKRFMVKGRMVSAEGKVTAYGIDGVRVAEGTEFELPAAGMYILTDGEQTLKIAVR